MRKRVVITGLGCISPVGHTVNETWEALLAGKSGAAPITQFDASAHKTKFAAEVKGFDGAAMFGTRDARKMDRFTQLALAATLEALGQSGLTIDESNRDRVGIIIGTGIGGIGTLLEQVEVLRARGPERVSPFLIPMMIADGAAGMIAIRLGARGPNMALTTACATGTNTLGEAAEMIRRDAADVMLAGGSEAAITAVSMAGMNVMTALSTRNDAPEKASRPFDKQRDGFLMGEGAGVLVLESLEHAQARGAKILCEFKGYGTSDDAHHISAPAENGAGAAISMQLALEDAGLKGEDIGYINAHGTSTQLNDKSETAAIKTVFGEQAYTIPISSTKSMTGHLLGASGAVEAIVCAKVLENDILPATINYEFPDPECDLDYVPNQPRKAHPEHIMSNSFGFGGHNAIGAASTLLADGAVVLVVGALVWLGVSVTVRQRVLGSAAFAAAFVVALVPYAAWRGGSAGWQGPWGLSGHGGLDSATDAMAQLAPGERWSATEAAAQTIATTPGQFAAARDHLSTRHPFDDAFLHYAHAFSLPAWLLVVALVVGIAGAVGLARARRSDLQAACVVVVMVPLAAVVGLALGPAHAWHAHLLLLVWGPACGALGVTALMRGRRSPAVGRSPRDPVDDEALRLFAEHYGSPGLAPVVIVIATYNEAEGLPDVLATLPDEVCRLQTDVVVVDDGSSDGTSEVARSDRRAFVACCGRNRGQGAALRLGYRIAREHGARYIITTDADGQYDSRDFPVVLAPLLTGEADFVTGSRRRGRQHTYDRFRRLGVHVFAWVATILTGTWLTDTSFGLRAMRAELTGVVTLDQPQYQSSELLLATISHGFPVREVPGTMHLRNAGSSKKGPNLVYGARYARVVFGTWWREGCPRPAADRAAALRPRRKA